MRVVVCLGTDPADPWELSAARLHDPTWISGGIRTLHELAVAAAAAGFETEVRGDFCGPVLAELTAQAGVRVATPPEPRRAEPGDIVCVPDGIRDPAFYVRVALMPCTPVYLAFAPPGLFGWSFRPGWAFRDALDVDPWDVGRPDQCIAIDSLGYHVWSNAATTAAAFKEAGVPARILHEGWPDPPRGFPDKDVDVVTVGDNRWADDTRRAMKGFRGTWREIPALPYRQMMEELGRGELLVHCMRIEGHSRIGVEARLMGTCCVGVASNRFAVGFDEEAGGSTVEDLAEIPAALERLLGDRTTLRARQERAQSHARAQTDWTQYVSRVAAAIAATSDDRHAAWRQTRLALHERERRLIDELRATQARRSVQLADRLGRAVDRVRGHRSSSTACGS